MFNSLPKDAHGFMQWPWNQIEPYFQDLAQRPLHAANVSKWLADWSLLQSLIAETYSRLAIATTVNTLDEEAERQYRLFLDEIFPNAQAADQALKEKLVASGLQPNGFDMPLRNMRAEIEIFRAENLPLLAEEMKLGIDYDKITGAQSVTWEGEERTVPQMRAVLEDPDRARRERGWRLTLQRQLQDREALGDLWGRLLNIRRQVAENAELPDYRAYQWRVMHRFDYSPADCRTFQDAIESAVVPVVERLNEKRRRQLGVDVLHPWDVDVDPFQRPALQPADSAAELEAGVARIFHQVDPRLGEYFETMRREQLLDLDNRKNKAPGGYCTNLDVAERPFIFMNAVGIHDDVQTLLHEGGHAFHVFETSHLPYLPQRMAPMEFAEVASMSMELLAAPYLTSAQGGFYSQEEAARAIISHLEGSLRFWPYMAVVDAFQHWVYENPQAALDPANCDQTWGELWQRFMPGVDWSGLEDELVTGWQRKGHIFQAPFYYVEYGLAQLGALQVWRNALSDQAQAVRDYRRALALGGAAPLPQLFETAGARFAFDAETLGAMAALAERQIEALENQL